MALKTIWCVLVSLAVVSAADYQEKEENELNTTKSLGFVSGIDVSRHQGLIDWAKVKAAGASFAIAKATEGSIYFDPTFPLNYPSMLRNGIAAGAYHYLRGKHSVNFQIKNILTVLTANGFNRDRDILAIDVEGKGNEQASPDEMANILYGVLESLKGTFRNIYIYTGPSYWENMVAWRKYDFSMYKLWISHYTPNAPTIPTTWKSQGYTLWQYTDKGTVGGISGFVDLNRSK